MSQPVNYFEKNQTICNNGVIYYVTLIIQLETYNKMKRVFIVCLLALGMNATTKAQCPINEILVTRDLSTIATMIDNNTECIKQSLAFNPEYANFKMYLDYLY